MYVARPWLPGPGGVCDCDCDDHPPRSRCEVLHLVQQRPQSSQLGRLGVRRHLWSVLCRARDLEGGGGAALWRIWGRHYPHCLFMMGKTKCNRTNTFLNKFEAVFFKDKQKAKFSEYLN